MTARMRNRITGETGDVKEKCERYMIVGTHLVWREFWDEWEVVE